MEIKSEIGTYLLRMVRFLVAQNDRFSKNLPIITSEGLAEASFFADVFSAKFHL